MTLIRAVLVLAAGFQLGACAGTAHHPGATPNPTTDPTADPTTVPQDSATVDRAGTEPTRPRARQSRRGPATTPPNRSPTSGNREPGKLAGITAEHNQVRASVGLPPLVWSSKLARWAQGWADQLAARGCDLEHRPGGSDAYGENLFWSSNGSLAAAVVAQWASERAGYDHASNRCRGVCGHYTQVVWRNTARVGCGVAACGEAEVWVCNYDPPGNFVGESPY